MRTRSPSVPAVQATPADTAGPADTAIPADAATPAGDRPRNRAERRAAARGRDTTAQAGGPSAPRSSGPAVAARPAHTRPDFAARRSG